VPSALLLDVGFVIIDLTDDTMRAYEAATDSHVPGLAEAAAERDWDELGRLTGVDGMVGVFRALAALVPATIFVPAAVDLIDAAGAGGVPIGVLTNHAYAMLGRDWYAGRPELAGLRTFVDAAEEGYPKPDPRGYLVAAERLGVAAEEVVFLDDTPECVDGARAVGMTGILVDPADRQPAFDEARRLLGLR
jgi:FMN phosphatase YigB (HAD superfamily)